jgi:hypothetical protein
MERCPNFQNIPIFYKKRKKKIEIARIYVRWFEFNEIVKILTLEFYIFFYKKHNSILRILIGFNEIFSQMSEIKK